MKNLNCDVFQIAFEFDEKIFKKKEFIKDVKPKQKSQPFFVYTFGSKFKTRKEHAHLLLVLDGKESNVRIGFVSEETESEDVREPYSEDVVDWLSTFFKEESFELGILSVFKFSRDAYESELQIDYPTLLANKLLKGSKVVGHDLDFPDDALINRASINANEKNLIIFLNSKISINLSEFEFYKMVEKFSQYANALVKKKEVE